MSDALLPLQVAVVAALDGNISAPVLDHVRATQAMPYAVIGEPTARAANLMGQRGEEITFPVIVVTRADGWAEGHTIAGQVRARLDGATLAVAGWNVVRLTTAEDPTTTARRPDGSRQLIVRYRVHLLEE